jgi:hypothetical protein
MRTTGWLMTEIIGLGWLAACPSSLGGQFVVKALPNNAPTMRMAHSDSSSDNIAKQASVHHHHHQERDAERQFRECRHHVTPSLLRAVPGRYLLSRPCLLS